MSIKKTTLLLLLTIIVPLVLPGKVVPLPGIINPESIAIDGEKAFITEKASVYIFSLKDFKLLNTFGRKGEGPSEFKVAPGIPLKLYIQPDYLLIDSMGKISIFSKEGKFIKEKRTSFPLSDYQPSGKLFVGTSIEFKDRVKYVVFYFYNENLEKKKEFFRLEAPYQNPPAKFNPLTQDLDYYTRYDRIFIHEANEVIHVFDSEGKEIFVLRFDFDKVHVSDELKQEIYDYYKNHPSTKASFENFKKFMKFPEVLPPLRQFRVADNRIYVLPYWKEKGKNCFYIFDMSGKFIKKVPVLLQERNILELFPYTIEKGKIYQPVENDDEEVELHIQPIEGD
jgi:hypothetical protein